MQTERRSAPRQDLNSLLYLDLEPDNGGILLNLSETGMQISVARRLVTSTEVRFTLCLKPREKISGTGRIAWLSPSGRSAGVHFLDLPESARWEIRQWMNQTADEGSAKESPAIHKESEETSFIGRTPVTPIEMRAPNDSGAGTLPGPPSPPLDLPESVEEHAQEILELVARAAESGPLTPTVMEAQSSQPAESMAATQAAEASPAEAAVAEASTPVLTDPLELLASTVEAGACEPAPPAWAPPFIPPIETPLPSLLSLYDMDGRDNEGKPLPATPPALKEEGGIRAESAVTHIGGREAHRRDRALARSSSPSRSEGKSNSAILDGQRDASVPTRPSAPASGEKAVRARPVKLASPIFIPAPPQFQWPAPESPIVAAQTAALTPTTNTSPAIEPLAGPSLESPVTGPAASPPPVTDAEQATLAHGALYLPNYKVRGITPDGTWRASRLFSHPLMVIPEIMERFETFGWSLESDWHTWLALVLLFAGFLSLAQNPPLVVLTVAFWFASAVVVLDRKRPRHSPMRPQKPDAS